MSKAKSNKTQPSRTQRGKVHARNAQPKHAYMYTRHNDHRHIRKPIANRNPVYRNTPHWNSAHRIYARRNTAHMNSAHCQCNCMSHSRTQKSHRKHHVPQHIRHVPYTRKAYHPRVNNFANVECFYCMTKGHTSNVCYYRKLHLNMLPMDYFETNQPRPRKVWV